MAEFKSVLLAPSTVLDYSSEHLKFPLLASRKMDGIRAVIMDGVARSRNMKPLRFNFEDRFPKLAQLSMKLNRVFDGEMYCHNTIFGNIQKAISTTDSFLEEGYKFHVFDTVRVDEWDNDNEPAFLQREAEYRSLFSRPEWQDEVVVVEQRVIENAKELQAMFEQAVEEGYEGLMVRSARGRYKHGRATLRDGLIYKFKAWVTIDARIVGFTNKQVMRDPTTIERTRDELGRMKRVHSKDSRMEIDEIGTIIVGNKEFGQFGVGIAKDAEPDVQLIEWSNRMDYLGHPVEIRCMLHAAKDKPRFGHITRFRHDLFQ